MFIRMPVNLPPSPSSPLRADDAEADEDGGGGDGGDEKIIDRTENRGGGGEIQEG